MKHNADEGPPREALAGGALTRFRGGSEKENYIGMMIPPSHRGARRKLLPLVIIIIMNNNHSGLLLFVVSICHTDGLQVVLFLDIVSMLQLQWVPDRLLIPVPLQGGAKETSGSGWSCNSVPILARTFCICYLFITPEPPP